MKSTTFEYLNNFINRYPKMAYLKDDLLKAFEILFETVKNGGTIFTCGNGGSASDSIHIVGELQKSFMKKRPLNEKLVEGLDLVPDYKEVLLNHLEGGIKAISLVEQSSLNTAYINDNYADTVYAQSLSVLGNEKDTLIAISTSGNSKNVVYAAAIARAKHINVVSLTGNQNSKLESLSNIVIKAPEKEVYKVQECHLPIYHLLCQMLEEEYFD